MKSWTNTLIQFTVPDYVTSGQVQVVVNQTASNKVPFEFVKSPPILDKACVFMGTTYFPGYQSWGAFEPNKKTLYIQGKGWSRDPAKTFVKVNGKEVPITGYSGPTLPENTHNIDMPNIFGSFNVTIISEGMESETKSFYRGVPPEILHKMPLRGFANIFRANYNDHLDGGKQKTQACYFSIDQAYNNLESYSWSGNTLTIHGKGSEYIGTHKVVMTLNEFGTKVTRVEVDITSLNTDIKFTIVSELAIELWGMYNQLKFVRTAMSPADYQFISGTYRWTSPDKEFKLTGMAENEKSWPNEFALWLELKN